MSKKCISLAMSLILLAGMLCCGTLVPATAETTWSYQAVSAVPEGSLLTGMTPTKGATTTAWTSSQDMALLTDGTLCTDNNTQRIQFAGTKGDFSSFTFDLGGVYSVSDFLVGSEADTIQRQVWVKIYASQQLSILYDDANLLIEKKGTTSTEKNLLYSLAEGAEVTAQYIGFSVYTTADQTDASTNFGINYGYGSIRLGELAVYGDMVYATSQATTAPEGNLLVGLTPFRDTDPNQLRLQEFSNLQIISTTALADNQFATASGEGRLFIYTTYKITWDMGAICDLNGFLVSSEAAKAQWLNSVKIYASTDLSTLYDDGNLAYDGGCNQWQNTVITLGEAVTGRYVGFDFTADSVNGTNGVGWLRMGELGAYGKKLYTLSQATTAPEGNLLVGLTPFQVETSDRYRLQEYTNLQSIQPTALADNVFATKTVVNNSTTHQGRLIIFNNRNICWDLGGLYDLTGFLVSSEINSSDWLNSVTLYVSDTEEDIYNESNLVQAGVDVSQWQTTVITLAESVTGRYIAFDFISDSENFAGSYYRLGELGAYGTAKQAEKKSLGAGVRSQNEDGTYALRFGFSVEFSGIDYAAEGSYARQTLDENSTIMVDGVMRQVTDFGTVVSISAASADDLVVNCDGVTTKKVPAKNLYEIKGGVVTFTAVVTNVPADHVEDDLYARSYVEYKTADGTPAYLYGEMLARSVNSVKDAIGLV